jgi:hypothetical protein
VHRALIVCSFLGFSVNASAAFITLDISSLVNSPLGGYFNGANYPAPGDIVIGGVPFTLYGSAGTTSVIGGLASVGTSQIYSLSGLNIGGAMTMYVIMNSAFGTCGSDVGSVSAGTSSSTASFTITEGTNLRDHYFGADSPYCQAAPGVFATANYPDSVRFDVFRFDISGATLGGTLPVADFEFQTFGQGLLGEPFVAAVTFENFDRAPVPEPSSLTMILVGVSAILFGARRRRF